MDPERLRRLVEDLPPQRQHRLHSLLIVRRGRLVMEE